MTNHKRCDGASRRNFLRVGGLTALGLGLGDYLGAQRLLGSVGSLPRQILPRQRAKS
ncbi:MAG: hypothetical protein ACI9SE_004208, partial [Neolewinella sp.]